MHQDAGNDLFGGGIMLAAIYSRQSAEKADSVSIETQAERCARVCAAHGWDFKLYSDRGFSGKSMDRPAFRQLLSDAENGVIKAVVSYKLDRVSRSMADFARLLELFSRNGVEYISATEQFDTSSPAGRAMIYIIMVFAQLERETITQRVSDNYRYRASMGLYMGGGVPYGYKARRVCIAGRQASVLEVDPEKAPNVEKIFSVFLAGANTKETAACLRAYGIAAPRGGAFTASSVARILRNMTYCADGPELFTYLKLRGYRVASAQDDFDGSHGMCLSLKTCRGVATPASGRIAAIGAHEPIIGTCDWIAAQRRLDAAANGVIHTRPSSRGWLAGLIRCAECGGSLGFKTCGANYAYYFCRNGCGRWVDARALENAVGVNLVDRARKLIRLLDSARENPCGTQAALLTAELENRRAQLDNIAAAIGRGAELDAALSQKAEVLGAECRKLTLRLSRITKRSRALISARQTKTSDIAPSVPLAFEQADVALKRRLARLLIEYVSIGKAESNERRANIYFR